MNILALFFNPIAYYPPMLHTFRLLAEAGYDVTSFSIGETDPQLKLKQTIDIKTILRHNSERGSLGTFRFFLRFCRKIISDINANNYKVVILYDDIGLLAWSLIRPFCRVKPDIWYHNHDVTESKGLKRLSLGSLSLRAQKAIFASITIFSIPATERLQYFPLDLFKGQLFHLPNFPARYLFEPLQKKKADLINNRPIRVIYQGRVSDGHGIIEFIDFIKDQPNILLTIVGPSTLAYLNSLQNKIKATDTGPRVTILSPLIYEELVLLTAEHDIGLAINVPKDIIYSTGGTASNKLYEYAALGLPTLYYDHEHYRKYLGEYEWAMPVDLSAKSFESAINNIVLNYYIMSESASDDFLTKFNYELEFQKVVDFLNIKYENT